MPDPTALKMFGVALDASDDPMSLELKWAAMMAEGREDAGFEADPYDAVAARPGIRRHFDLIGKVPVPTWLGPCPKPSDMPMLDLARIQEFYDGKGFLRISSEVQRFVETTVFPARPAMIGIDHSASGGVVAALSKRLGPKNLTVVVLDRHFDGLKPSERLTAMAGQPMPFSEMAKDEYCCGSFWSYLLDEGAIRPENLLFIGVADYPRETMGEEWRGYRDAYLGFERRGCRFFPLTAFEGDYRARLKEFLRGGIKTEHLYVSLDIDVGSLNAVLAARYMDGPGLNRAQLRDVAEAIAGRLAGGGATLAGLDLVEFNMHFLGVETDDGLKDETLEVAEEFLDALLSGE